MKNKILQLFILVLVISSCTYDYLEQPTKVNSLRLSTNSLLLPQDGTVSIVEILNGEGGFSVSSQDEDTATAKVVGKEIHITPIGLGKTIIVVTDKKTGNIEKVNLDIQEINFNERISVEGGSFVFGEKTITITDFYIGKYEVTVRDFCNFFNDANNGYSTNKVEGVLMPNPELKIHDMGIEYKIVESKIVCFPKVGMTNLPITNINWTEAQKYCTWIGGRLPSDTEWEYAAQGGVNGPGNGNVEMDNKFIDTIAWWENNRNGFNELHDVQTKQPNALGIHNMIGNVSEWVMDSYPGSDSYSYSDTNPNKDAHIPLDGKAYVNDNVSHRIIRGGSTGYCPVKNTIHNSKMSLPQGFVISANGFRVAYDTP